MVPRFPQSSDGPFESSSRRISSMPSQGPYIPIKRKSAGSEILENIARDQSIPVENGKVAIPRHRTGVVPRNPGRVSRACESCRLRKTKCSGDSPICRQCHELNATCVYPLAFRERTKQQIRGLTQRLRACEDLLKEVENIVPERISKRIHALLKQGDSHSNIAAKQANIAMSSIHDADSFSSLSAGSLEAVDRAEDSHMADESLPTRNFEKSSDMSWRQEKQKEADQNTKSQSEVPDLSKTDRFDRHNMDWCRGNTSHEVAK